jgi:hypothetical protein
MRSGFIFHPIDYPMKGAFPRADPNVAHHAKLMVARFFAGAQR